MSLYMADIFFLMFSPTVYGFLCGMFLQSPQLLPKCCNVPSICIHELIILLADA